MAAPDLSTIANVATAATVLTALVFGVLQMRQNAAQRREFAAVDALNKMLSPEFLASLDAILQLPDDARPEQMRDDVPLRRAFLLVDYTIEAVGVMVHERMVPLLVLDRMIGGVVRIGWKKVRPFVEAERHRVGRPNPGEWWQWLVERMQEHPAPGKAEGAHIAFRAWRS